MAKMSWGLMEPSVIRVAGLDLIPFLHPDAGTVGNDIAFLVHVAVDVPGDVHHPLFLLFAVADDAVDFGDDGEMLGLAAFKEFLDPGKTLGDILGGRDAAGVEGPHGQLGAGFTDGLGGDGADRLADRDRIDRREIGAVAVGADAVLGFAGQD